MTGHGTRRGRNRTKFYPNDGKDWSKPMFTRLPNGAGRTGSQAERDRDDLDRTHAERVEAAERRRKQEREAEDERIRRIIREERSR